MNTPEKSQRPIVSLSLNPAIDLTYEVANLKHDQKSRATKTYYDPGGTGINVGRALQELGATSHTCSITAGAMGEFLNSLLKQELKNCTTLQVEGETRINTTILQKSPYQQYEINDTGPAISPCQLDEIVGKFLSLCKQGFGILTGSLPPGISDSTYRTISEQLKKQGAHAIIDAPIDALNQALFSNPFLIKPNLHELEMLQNTQLTTIEQIASEARKLVEKGTQNVCVSLAEKGAILTTSVNSFYCPSPKTTVHSTVGAGDSVVAGLAHAYAQNKSPEQAIKLAVACGVSTAKQPGTQLFNLSDVTQSIVQMDIVKLDI